MNPAAQVYGLGDELKTVFDAVVASAGKVFWLDPTNGNDGNDGQSPDKAFKSLASAYAAMTSGANDVLYLIGNGGSAYLSSAFTWAKSYCHLVGVAAPVGVSGRARIAQLGTATGVGTMVTVSGSGNVFKNIQFFQGVNDATSNVCVSVTGQRNYFDTVHFAGIGHATMDDAGAASLKVDGGAENVFKNCFIGLDTIARGANSTELWFDGGATRNRFEDCTVYAYISNAGHALVTVEDGTAIDRFCIFTRCKFLTDSTNQSISGTEVFKIKTAIVQGKIILDDSWMLTDGASATGEWDSNNRGIIWNNRQAPAGAGVGGVCTKQ
jgi:hypothetical protein